MQYMYVLLIILFRRRLDGGRVSSVCTLPGRTWDRKIGFHHQTKSQPSY